jgi:uncharacterized RDD family membrane protein YckC
MRLDIQKANMWKRISAALFDVIILSVVVALLAMVLSGVLGFDRYNNAMDACYSKYEAMYGISFDITLDEYNAMTQEEIALYEEAYKSFSVDPDAIYNFNMIVRLTLTIASISILLGYLIMEFAIPLFLGNGRTLGKRIFGIGVIRAHSVRITPVALFIRTVLGKFAIETMVSVLIILMIFWGTIGIVGPLVIAGILILQVLLLATSPTRSVIHDRLSDTVVVDMESQRIFENEDELIEYTKRLHAEKASKQVY